MSTETAIHFSKARLLFAATLTLFLVVLFWAITAAVFGELSDEPLILVVVVIFGFLGAFLFVIFAWTFARLFSRAPALVVGDRGLTDHSNVFGVGFVPWTNIVDAHPYQHRANRGVMVILKDPKAVLRGQPFAKSLGIHFTALMSVTPMWIPTSALSVSVDQLLAMIRERARAQPAAVPTIQR